LSIIQNFFKNTTFRKPPLLPSSGKDVLDDGECKKKIVSGVEIVYFTKEELQNSGSAVSIRVALQQVIKLLT
jgi:hypothetical protein